MYLEDAGTIYKGVKGALNNHFKPKQNVVFERHHSGDERAVN